MKKIISTIAFSLMFTINGFSQADFSVFLYQPDNVLSERIPGGAEEVASFIFVVNQIWEQVIVSDTERQKTAIVIGIGYERQVTAWVINSKSDIDEKVTSELRKHKAPWVRNGVFAFGLTGAEFKLETKEPFSPPIPDEWKVVAEKQASTISVDCILDILLSKNLSPQTNTPDGYKIQTLEPLGGKILRPNGWYYSENHSGSGYSWTISKEDSSEAPYKTGVKIQLLAGIKEGTGKTPKEFCDSFLQSKANSTKVVKEFPETKQGVFTRKGVEVEEVINSETYHVIYSAFWLDSDLVLISIAGSPKKLWDKYNDTFQVMSGFEFIDMKRFVKESEPEHAPVQENRSDL